MQRREEEGSVSQYWSLRSSPLTGPLLVNIDLVDFSAGVLAIAGFAGSRCQPSFSVPVVCVESVMMLQIRTHALIPGAIIEAKLILLNWAN